MTSDDGPPVWKTGVLWVILAVLLTVGTVGAAFFVDGLTIAWGGGASLLALAAMLSGGIVSFLSFLFMAGILYRVDRYRGVAHRRVELFE